MGIKELQANHVRGRSYPELTRELLEESVDVTEAGCWEWQGARTAGYGSYGNALVHRLAYELYIGPIPDGLLVCHKCDNAVCCNPVHLFTGTYSDNNADCRGKGRHGGNTKLSIPDVLDIRTRRYTGETCRDLSMEYGLDETYVATICSGGSWVSVGGPLTKKQNGGAGGKIQMPQVLAMRRERLAGATLSELSRKYGVTRSAVRHIVTKRAELLMQSGYPDEVSSPYLVGAVT